MDETSGKGFFALETENVSILYLELYSTFKEHKSEGPKNSKAERWK